MSTQKKRSDLSLIMLIHMIFLSGSVLSDEVEDASITTPPMPVSKNEVEKNKITLLGDSELSEVNIVQIQPNSNQTGNTIRKSTDWADKLNQSSYLYPNTDLNMVPSITYVPDEQVVRVAEAFKNTTILGDSAPKLEPINQGTVVETIPVQQIQEPIEVVYVIQPIPQQSVHIPLAPRLQEPNLQPIDFPLDHGLHMERIR